MSVASDELHLSYAGFTRVSINLRKERFRMMDYRGKPDNDK
jgi:hypothetical protein